MLKKTITLLSLIIGIQAHAFITVGADNVCDYDSIQEAIDSNSDDVIRIARNKNYFENIVISNKSKELIGGYANCSQANLNITDLSQATITANGIDDAVNLETTENGNYYVALRNLIISNGLNGIYADAQSNSLDVILDNVWSYNNLERGVYGSDTDITINDSRITFNQGGGIRCIWPDSSLTITGQTVISDNKATYGGGIDASQGCSVSIYSPTQIINNEAILYGGGIHLTHEPTILSLYGHAAGEQNGIPLGEWESPVTISENQADYGGAISTSNEASVFIYNALIETNQATSTGGAIYSTGASTILASSYEEPGQTCWSPGACLQFKGNKAAIGGVTYSRTQSKVNISGALFTENRSSFGVVSNASTGGTVNITGSIISNNGQNGDNNFTDDQLFKISSGNNQISKTTLDYVTVVDNHVVDELIENTEGSVAVYSSIILDDTVDVYQEAGQQSQMHIECAMVREDDSFIPGPVVSVTNDDLETIFTNPAAGNYHLADDSPAIDYCYNASGIISLDIDGDTRGVDNFDVVNFEGTYDIGADETESVSDLIFKDDFE